jgi:hypothetical protein
MPKKVKNEQQEPPPAKDNAPTGGASEKTNGASQAGEQQNPPPKPPEDDVATPKQDDPLLGKVGEAIHESSAAAESSAQELVVHACKCGLLMCFGKSIAGHGAFDHWCDTQNFRFSKMSRSKYMRLADKLCKHGKSKPDLLLLVDHGPDGRPSAFKVAEEQLRELVQKVVQSRSLTELYLDWDIGKKTATAKKSQPAGQARSQAAMRRWLQSLDHAAPIIQALPQARRSEVVAKIEALLRVLKSESNQTGQ